MLNKNERGYVIQKISCTGEIMYLNGVDDFDGAFRFCNDITYATFYSKEDALKLKEKLINLDEAMTAFHPKSFKAEFKLIEMPSLCEAMGE